MKFGTYSPKRKTTFPGFPIGCSPPPIRTRDIVRRLVYDDGDYDHEEEIDTTGIHDILDKTIEWENPGLPVEYLLHNIAYGRSPDPSRKDSEQDHEKFESSTSGGFWQEKKPVDNIAEGLPDKYLVRNIERSVDAVKTTAILTAEKNCNFALPVKDAVCESFMWPTEWSQDSVFLPPRKIVVETAMSHEAGKNRTLGTTSAENGAELTGAKDSLTECKICPKDLSASVPRQTFSGETENGTVSIAADTTRVVGETSSAASLEGCMDFCTGSMSWKILSSEQGSLRDQPLLCSTPLPPPDSNEEASAGGEESGAPYSSWYVWVPLACLAVAGFCAVKYYR